MKDKKLVGIDILRAAAVLLVMLYHMWVCGGTPEIKFVPLRRLVSLGGEIGVTLFFILSGFGIYYSLARMERINGKVDVASFVKRRCRRILPQYYVNVLFVLTIGTGAAYISMGHWKNILSHIFFVHNFVLDWSGAVNGVLWSMGIIVQFYLLSIPMYKLLNKMKYFFVPCSVILTILVKAGIYRLFLPEYGGNGFYLGRSLVVFTSLDNFAIGMFCGWLAMNRKTSSSRLRFGAGAVIGYILLDMVCKAGRIYGIHTGNMSGYVFHSGVAVALGVIIWAFAYAPFSEENLFVKCFQWIAKYQYGIYLWHLIIIRNWTASSTLIMDLIGREKYWIAYTLMGISCMVVGVVVTKIIDEGYMRIRKEK